MFHPDDIKRMAILATLAMLCALHSNMARAAAQPAWHSGSHATHTPARPR